MKNFSQSIALCALLTTAFVTAVNAQPEGKEKQRRHHEKHEKHEKNRRHHGKREMNHEAEHAKMEAHFKMLESKISKVKDENVREILQHFAQKIHWMKHKMMHEGMHKGKQMHHGKHEMHRHCEMECSMMKERRKMCEAKINKVKDENLREILQHMDQKIHWMKHKMMHHEEGRCGKGMCHQK